jgi:hypothetical protein
MTDVTKPNANALAKGIDIADQGSVMLRFTRNTQFGSTKLIFE